MHFLDVEKKKCTRRMEEEEKWSCEFYETPLKFFGRKTLEGHVTSAIPSSSDYDVHWSGVSSLNRHNTRTGVDGQISTNTALHAPQVRQFTIG